MIDALEIRTGTDFRSCADPCCAALASFRGDEGWQA